MTDIISYLHDTTWQDIPKQVKHSAYRSLMDTVGVSAAASKTKLSEIITAHAVRMFGGDQSRIWWTGNSASPVGAALANGMTIDAVDAHDGQKLTKGHIGCGLIPGLMAITEAEGKLNSEDIMTALVIGYEFGARAGISLHASVKDYHTSGAWIAVTVAAIGARVIGMNAEKTRHAMGIAEYHGPRSQMMRCIDFPTMVKDGSGWGSMAGVSATYLAADGFTGAPAISIEADEVSSYWSDLGQHHYMNEQYIKLYPVCRWAQPAVEAVLGLVKEHAITPDQIAAIDVESFDEAVRLCAMAENTEQAQYSLPFSVAAAALRGTIGINEISESGLKDHDIQAMARKIRITPNDDFNAVFPRHRIASATIKTHDGQRFVSPPTEARGDPEEAVSDDMIRQKFRTMAGQTCDEQHCQKLENALGNAQDLPDIDALLRLMR